MMSVRVLCPVDLTMRECVRVAGLPALHSREGAKQETVPRRKERYRYSELLGERKPGGGAGVVEVNL